MFLSSNASCTCISFLNDVGVDKYLRFHNLVLLGKSRYLIRFVETRSAQVVCLPWIFGERFMSCELALNEARSCSSEAHRQKNVKTVLLTRSVVESCGGTSRPNFKFNSDFFIDCSSQTASFEMHYCSFTTTTA